MAFNLLYANQGSIRNKPVMPNLAKIYEQAATRAGIDAIRVVSGGQDATGPHRTGSHRHDLGGAGDIQLLVGGRPLDFTNKADLPIIQNFFREGRALGLTGVGAGSGYMGNTTYHAGFGPVSVWGAGGRSKNAPQWLSDAFGSAKGVSLASAPGAGLSAPTVSAAPAAPASDPMAAGMKLIQQGLGGTPAATEEAAPAQSVGAPISAGAGGQDLSAGAATLMNALLDSRRKRYGLSLTGMPNV